MAIDLVNRQLANSLTKLGQATNLHWFSNLAICAAGVQGIVLSLMLFESLPRPIHLRTQRKPSRHLKLLSATAMVWLMAMLPTGILMGMQMETATGMPMVLVTHHPPPLLARLVQTVTKAVRLPPFLSPPPLPPLHWVLPPFSCGYHVNKRLLAWGVCNWPSCKFALVLQLCPFPKNN